LLPFEFECSCFFEDFFISHPAESTEENYEEDGGARKWWKVLYKGETEGEQERIREIKAVLQVESE